MMEINRVSREKEWHNQTFGSDIRFPMKKFYSISIDRNKIFQELVYRELDGNKILLDYGCGTGNKLIEIYNKITKGIGIDISEVRIENAKLLAKEKSINNLDFFVMDAMNTTFKNETFDIIRGSGILHHLDLENSLRELKRILKSTGKCFFSEPLDTNFFIFLYRKLTPYARTKDEQPLRRKDIKLIKKYFPNMEISFYSFFTLFAVPFRNLKYFLNIFKILSFMDRIILNKYSPLKYLAWVCILTLKK